MVFLQLLLLCLTSLPSPPVPLFFRCCSSDLTPLSMLPEGSVVLLAAAPDLDIRWVLAVAAPQCLSFAHPAWSCLPYSLHLLLLCLCSQGWCDRMCRRDLNFPATLSSLLQAKS